MTTPRISEYNSRSNSSGDVKIRGGRGGLKTKDSSVQFRSFPTHREGPQWWINTCNDGEDDTGKSLRDINDVVSDLGRLAREAKLVAEGLQFEYEVNVINDENFAENEGNYVRYNYLPVPPELSNDHVVRIKMEDGLKDSLEYLQYYAICFEQVVNDQHMHGRPYIKNFIEVMQQMRHMVCLLGAGCRLLSVELKPPVFRNTKPAEITNQNTTRGCDVKCWVILRDYIKTLYYISVIFGNSKPADFK